VEDHGNVTSEHAAWLFQSVSRPVRRPTSLLYLYSIHVLPDEWWECRNFVTVFFCEFNCVKLWKIVLFRIWYKKITWGLQDDDGCILCNQESETVAHVVWWLRPRSFHQEWAPGRNHGQIVTLIYVSFHYQIDSWPPKAVSERALRRFGSEFCNLSAFSSSWRTWGRGTRSSGGCIEDLCLVQSSVGGLIH
jgi:hypothetical protein